MKRGCSIIPIAFSDFDISLLERFSPKKLNLKIIDNIEKFAKENNIDTLVVGDNFENKKDYSVNLVFRPLIAFGEEEIERKLEEFKN